MRNLITIFSTFLVVSAFAADPGDVYRADKINDSLIKNANAVRRLDATEIEVIGSDKAVIKFHEIVTIMNEKSANELNFSFFTDKFHILEEAELKLFDAEGKQIERHTRKDLSSTASGSGLVEDGFVYYMRMGTAKYPVTVEKKYTLRYKGLLQLPGTFFSIPYQSVEKAVVTLKHPKSLQVNHKLYNTSITPVKTETANDIVLVWEMKNIESVKYEGGSGSWTYHAPGIRFNINNIEMDGFAGDMSSWNSMGLWYNRLVKNTNRLKPEYQDQIKKLVASAKDDKEKITILYRYLQDNFRYVSIQLGIGGFRPFPADFLHEKKYGDCKGLSNYMEACLDAVGIKSYSAWIRAGSDQIWLDPQFPNDIFNHQILMVPLKNDSVWLECTSNYNDFNHLGSFTESRYALLLTENGGKLVKTPAGKAEQNQWNGYSKISINPDGSGNSESSFRLTGEYKYEMIGLNMESPDNQKSYIINQYGFTHPDVMEIEFGDRKKELYQLNVRTGMEKVFDFKAGNKLFLKSRLYKIWSLKLDPQEKRKYDYLIEHPLSKSDTTLFVIPAGWTVEALPKNRSGSFQYGKFESRYWFDEATRTVYSALSLVINTKVIPASTYEESRKFFDLIIEDGNQKIVLRASD
ncbi:MAG TPA: transglutaminase family protein [Chitinophagaceae bacterium]|nr:transglutaminase family protein [Chitinophagaceae bacterium]